MSDLIVAFDLTPAALSHLTSAVQIGFITGTLIFAFLTIADRFSPSLVFVICAIFGALFNLGLILPGNSGVSLLAFRFFTGFFLAGIYPVGMKIAADYYQEGLGRSLGYLVGALVVGTAFPHLVKVFSSDLPWRTIVYVTSSVAVFGGFLLWLLVPDGPFRRRMQKPDSSAFLRVFKDVQFRSAAFGYFGHMWELYAFWTFIPVILQKYSSLYPQHTPAVSLWSFLIIGLGGVSCAVGGVLSERFGVRRSATFALTCSGICCLLVPWVMHQPGMVTFLLFLVFWGLMVIADSPLFSTLVAKHAPVEMKGTALTIVNCVGFSIIQLLNLLYLSVDSVFIYSILALGPLFGILSLRYVFFPSP